MDKFNQSIYEQEDKVSIQFDHVNDKLLKKEKCRSTFVRVVQTLLDWFFKFNIKSFENLKKKSILQKIRKAGVF